VKQCHTNVGVGRVSPRVGYGPLHRGGRSWFVSAETRRIGAGARGGLLARAVCSDGSLSKSTAIGRSVTAHGSLDQRLLVRELRLTAISRDRERRPLRSPRGPESRCYQIYYVQDFMESYLQSAISIGAIAREFGCGLDDAKTALAHASELRGVRSTSGAE
jgi:hypothetical protein